jgi:hypothetical protein
MILRLKGGIKMNNNEYVVTIPTAEHVRKLQTERNSLTYAEEIEDIKEKINDAIQYDNDYIYLSKISDKVEYILKNFGYAIKKDSDRNELVIRVSW